MISLVFTAISALIGIWLGYWIETKPTNLEQTALLKRKKKFAIVSSALLVIGLGFSYVELEANAAEENQKLLRELENYRKIDTIKQLGVEAGKIMDDLQTKSQSIQRSLEKVDTTLQASVGLANDNVVRLERLHLMELKQQQENAVTGILNFDFGKGLADSESITLKYGGNSIRTKVSQLKTGKIPFRFQFTEGQELFTFNIVNGKLTINLDSYDLNRAFIASIENNVWRRNPNSSAMFNYDNRGFEIIDNNGNVAINIDLVSKNTIVVQGYLLQFDQRRISACGPESCYFGPLESNLAMLQVIRRWPGKRLFEYNTTNWLHKRRK